MSWQNHCGSLFVISFWLLSKTCRRVREDIRRCGDVAAFSQGAFVCCSSAISLGRLIVKGGRSLLRLLKSFRIMRMSGGKCQRLSSACIIAGSTSVQAYGHLSTCVRHLAIWFYSCRNRRIRASDRGCVLSANLVAMGIGIDRIVSASYSSPSSSLPDGYFEHAIQSVTWQSYIPGINKLFQPSGWIGTHWREQA